MKSSESVAKLAAALLKVQAELPPITKGSRNPHFNASYASLDAIMEIVRPILAKHELSVVQGGAGPTTNDAGNISGVAVETLLLHASGEWLSCVLALPLEKATAQGVGSAITYARRYGVSAVLALSTEEDDDGNAASQRRATPKRQQPPTRPAQAPRAEKPEEVVLWFGHNKGKALGALDNDTLEGLVEWASADEEKQEKFKDLISAASAVIRSRPTPQERQSA